MGTAPVGPVPGQVGQEHQELIERRAKNRDKILAQRQEGPCEGIELSAKNLVTLEQATTQCGEFDGILPEPSGAVYTLADPGSQCVDPILAATDAFLNDLKRNRSDWPICITSNNCQKIKIYDAVKEV